MTESLSQLTSIDESKIVALQREPWAAFLIQPFNTPVSYGPNWYKNVWRRVAIETFLAAWNSNWPQTTAV